MALLISCASCGAQIKAPEKAVGRTVKCLRCQAPIVVSASSALPFAEPLPPPSDSAAEATPSPQFPVLTALLISGLGIAFLLVVILLVRLLTSSSNDPGTALPGANQPAPGPVAAVPSAPNEPPAPAFDRAKRLAELEAQEKTELATLLQVEEKHKETIQRLRKEEDEFFKKKVLPKAAARYTVLLKDLATTVRQANKDALALIRKREEWLQTKRKVLLEHPHDGDPKLEEYGELILTQDEIRTVGERMLSAGSPRAAALPHLQAAAAVTQPVYAGAFRDPDDADLAAVTYKVGSYRGKKESNLQVHIFVYRSRGAWSVLELPGRIHSVLPGPPPGDYKRLDSTL